VNITSNITNSIKVTIMEITTAINTTAINIMVIFTADMVRVDWVMVARR
jgi:hypothetical protein